MKNDNSLSLETKLDTIIGLLQHILALQLADRKISQTDIGKHLHIAKASVGKLLKGIKQDG